MQKCIAKHAVRVAQVLAQERDRLESQDLLATKTCGTRGNLHNSAVNGDVVRVARDAVVVKCHDYVNRKALSSLRFEHAFDLLSHDPGRPGFLHAVLQVWVIEDNWLAFETKIFTTSGEFLLSYAAETLRISVGKTQHVKFVCCSE